MLEFIVFGKFSTSKTEVENEKMWKRKER